MSEGDAQFVVVFKRESAINDFELSVNADSLVKVYVKGQRPIL